MIDVITRGTGFKAVDEMPTDGTQFVAVWKFRNKIWSDSFQVRNGVGYIYDTEIDDFRRAYSPAFEGSDDVLFLISKEDA